jgi:2-(1,2-epoxy-1,2-dihydrophenyl)acetyl-CoA isomerase
LKEGVFSITLNRPKVNAFNLELVSALQAALKQAERDKQARFVRLTGQGSVFSAGQDVGDFLSAGKTSYRQHLLQTYNPLVLQIRRLEKPVLAVIQGAVSGAALGLALACDLRMAALDARLVVGFLGIGLVPDSAVSLLLPLLVGLGRASEFTFTNEPISATQALDWGLVNRLAPVEELEARSLEWAQQLARGPVGAMGLAKRAFNRAILPQLEDVLDYEGHLQEIASQGSEHKEGVTAFFEKRAPRFN